MINDIAIGGYVDREVHLTPCRPDRSPAYFEKRQVKGLWAGRFRLLGSGLGKWAISVQSVDASQRWIHVFSAEDAADSGPWESDVISTETVELRLEQQGTNATVCPEVILEAELEETTKSKPRGLVGDDKRWTESNADLDVQPDATAVRQWGLATTRLLVLAANGKLVPCSGFFVAPHVLVSASHCLPTPERAAKSVVYVDGRTFSGKDIKLMISIDEGDLDFCVVWIKDAQPASTVSFGSGAPGPAVLWQQPRNGRLVSVVGCAVEALNSVLVPHRCDTEGGSSGAPVQSRSNGAVVAVHTQGCTATNLTPACVNFGARGIDIRARILMSESLLRTYDPVAAEEIIAAFGVLQ